MTIMFITQIRIYAYSNKYLFFFLQYIDKSYQYAFIPKTIIIFFPLGIHESYLSNLHFFISRKIIQIVFSAIFPCTYLSFCIFG